MANLEQLPNEMLANIILQLPAYQIYYLSRVSKFWKRLIEGTPSIRAAQAMASQNRTLHGFQIPAYEIDFGTPRQSTELMRFYPALVARDTFVGERKCWRYKTVLIDKHDVTTLTPRRAEYATFPRLKCLLMQIDRDKRVNIMIQKEEGIKIDDIIDARQTLNEIYYDTRPAYTSRQRSEDLVAQSNGDVRDGADRQDTCGRELPVHDAAYTNVMSNESFHDREQIREILESGSSGDGEGDGSARLIVKK